MNKEKIQYKNTEKFTPEVISEVLEVKEAYGLTAENLLRKASKKSSSLYEFFDWDNSSAGEKWRLNQARGLINEIKIIVEDKEVYAFENVNVTVEECKTLTSTPISKFGSREYKTIVEVMNNNDYREQLIHRALMEANYWKERHAELTELSPIFITIENENKKWQNKK
jgi:alpha-D-ribose 1-methylphosphonate 5-triphosphate synthase subunit PhnL